MSEPEAETAPISDTIDPHEPLLPTQRPIAETETAVPADSAHTDDSTNRAVGHTAEQASPSSPEAASAKSSLQMAEIEHVGPLENFDDERELKRAIRAAITAAILAAVIAAALVLLLATL